MAYGVESIGMLFTNIGLYGGGMALAILGFLLAVTRSTTKRNDMWALMFAGLSWAFALIIPNMWFAGTIFGIGTLSLVYSYSPLMKKMGEPSLFVLAIISITLNLTILFGVGGFTVSLGWQETMVTSETIINDLLGTQIELAGNSVPEYKLCAPNSINSDGTPCKDDVVSGSFVSDIFVPIASIVALGTYLAKAIVFVGSTLLVPIMLGTYLENSGMFYNQIITYFIGITILFIQMSVYYKVSRFVLNKHGES